MKPIRSTTPIRPRVASVGVSGYARRHLWFLEALADEVDLAAVVVVEKDQHLPEVAELRGRGVNIYADFSAMLREEAGRLDLCIIPTGIQWHARMTVAALSAGANVLVEKPLAGCEADARSILDAEQSSGRWVAVGFQDLYSSAVYQLKELLCGGRIGRLLSIRMIGMSARADDYYDRNNWAGRLTADGAATKDSPLNNAFAHLVNLALFFGGDSVLASAPCTLTGAELLRARNIESFDTAVVTGKLNSNVDFWIGVSHACADSPPPVIRIDGENGYAEWHRDRSFRIVDRDGKASEYMLKNDEGVCHDMYAALLRKLRGGTPRVCSTSIAYVHTCFVDAVHNRGTEIRTVDPALVDRPSVKGGKGQRISAIRGIRGFMESAFARRCLLAETGFYPDRGGV